MMAFVPTNYLTARAALDAIADEATRNKTTMENGVDRLVVAAAKFAAMPADWTDAIAFIEAQAVALPSDEQWQALKGEKDLIVTDFQVMRDVAIAKRNAAQAAG